MASGNSNRGDPEAIFFLRAAAEAIGFVGHRSKILDVGELRLRFSNDALLATDLPRSPAS